MSIVTEMSALFETKDQGVRDSIVQLLESEIPGFTASDWGRGSNTGDVSVRINSISDELNFCLNFDGVDGCDFFNYCVEKLNSKVECNYCAASEIEGYGILATIKHNGLPIYNLYFGPGDMEDDDIYFEMIGTDSYIKDLRDHVYRKYLGM